MEEGKKEEGNNTDKPENKMPIEKQVMILFAILMLIFASFLVSYQYFKPSSSFKYGDFTVHKSRLEGTIVDFYFIPIKMPGKEPFNIMIRNDPRAIENITMELNNSFLGGSRGMWITSGANYTSMATIAAGEIGGFLKGIGIMQDYAFTTEIGGYPVITCENATKEIKVVDLRLGNRTGVYQEGNCVIVEGTDYTEMVKASDRLVTNWLNSLYIEKKK